MTIALDEEVLAQIAKVTKEVFEAGIKGLPLDDLSKSVTDLVAKQTDLDARFEKYAKANALDSDAALKMVKDVIKGEVKAQLIELRGRQDAGDGEQIWEKGVTEFSNGVEVNHTRYKLPRVIRASTAAAGGDITGAPVSAFDPIHALVAANPYRAWITVQPVATGSFKLPNVTNVVFTKKKVAPIPNDPSAGQTGETVVTLLEADSDVFVSTTTLEDLPMLRMTYGDILFEAYAHIQGEDVFEVIKESVASNDAGSASLVKTGVANNLPTAQNVLLKLDEMIAAVPTRYRFNCAFQISRLLEARINAGLRASTGMMVMPGTMTTFYSGYPLVINDQLDDGTANNDQSAHFGNFRRGVFMGERSDLTIEEYDQTVPGGITFFARGRYAPAIWDPLGLVGLQTKA